MTRPPSIVWFERCYLGALLLSVIENVLQWDSLNARFAAIPNGAAMAQWLVPTMILVGLGIGLILWYFAARRAAPVAKWIVAVFFGIGLLGIIPAIFGGAFPQGLPGILSIVGLVLNAIAVWMLFRPDANAWFAKRPADIGNTLS